jgi:hypothetical protein
VAKPTLPSVTVDHSRQHPLDHWPWERECGRYYGGRRHHVHLEWEYGTAAGLRWWLRRPLQLVLCRLGRHDLTTAYSLRKWRYVTTCEFCDWEE